MVYPVASDITMTHIGSVADPGGLGGLTTLRGFLFVCQYMKIPADLDPNPPPPLEEFRPRPPPPPRRIPRSAPEAHILPESNPYLLFSGTPLFVGCPDGRMQTQCKTPKQQAVCARA